MSRNDGSAASEETHCRDEIAGPCQLTLVDRRMP